MVKKVAALCFLITVASPCFPQKKDAFIWKLATLREQKSDPDYAAWYYRTLGGTFRDSKTWTDEESALSRDNLIPPITIKRMSFGDCGGDVVPDDLDGCFVERSWTIFISPRLVPGEPYGNEMLRTIWHEVGHARQARLKMFRDPKFCDHKLPHDERPCEKNAEAFSKWVYEEMFMQ